MRLSDYIQSFQCWDELISVCQGELKFMDDVKSYFSERKKLEQVYAEDIRRLDAQYTKQCNNNSTSYFKKLWLKLLGQSTSAANCVTKGATVFEQEILPGLNAVSDKKKHAIAELITVKNRLESQISLVAKDIAKLQKSIEDFATATEANKVKYLETTKDQKNEHQEKYKTRFVSNACKLQEYNNDYNILLNVVSMHEASYIEHILPAWLYYHQNLLSSQISDLKSLLRFSFEVLLHRDDETSSYTMVMSTIYSYISKINFESEYGTFIDKHGTCPKLEPTHVEYCTLLQKHTSLNLPIKQLIVNELTDSGLKAKLEAHNIDLQHIDEKLDTKTQKLHDLDTGHENDDLDHECKKHYIKAQVHELHAQRCRYQMTVNFITENVAPWKDKPLEPFYKLLPVIIKPSESTEGSLMSSQCLGTISPLLHTRASTLGTLSRLRQLLSMGRSSSLELRDHNIGTPVDVKAVDEEDYVLMTKDDTSSTGSNSTNDAEDFECIKQLIDTEYDGPLEDQPWFHNDITRQETADLLQFKGQFLIRKTVDSKRRMAVLVLSVNTGAVGSGGVKHFVMQISEEALFRLEGAWFKSIPMLLNYHVETGKPITTKSLVIIRQAILRDKWNLLHRDIRLQQFLGNGNFGDVYQAQLLTTGREVAVKTCRETQNFRDKFVEEAETLKKFNHKNVVKLLGICCDEVPFYIVMEYMNNGSLLSVLQEGPTLPMKQLVHYCEQSAAGMVYLHGCNYIHRDLAARNCLIHNQTLLKISDFGMSRYQEKNSVYISKMKQIPIRWTAPECLMFRTYTFKSDIWSYGILVWEIFNKGEYPYSEFTNRDVKDQIDAGYRLPKSRGTPDNLYQIMFDCWTYEPKGRPTFETVHFAVKDIYIDNYSDQGRFGSMSSTGSKNSGERETRGTPPDE